MSSATAASTPRPIRPTATTAAVAELRRPDRTTGTHYLRLGRSGGVDCTRLGRNQSAVGGRLQKARSTRRPSVARRPTGVLAPGRARLPAQACGQVETSCGQPVVLRIPELALRDRRPLVGQV